MTALYLHEDAKELLAEKTLVVMGDSVLRSVYKDVVCLLQENRYLTDQELRKKGELSFIGDELVYGGQKSEQKNSTSYRECRYYKSDFDACCRYYFVTICYGDYVEQVLQELSLEPTDIIVMNSCLWDVHRNGRAGIENYEENLEKLVLSLRRLMPDCIFLWLTTPPVATQSKGGFLERPMQEPVKIQEVKYCNQIAREVFTAADNIYGTFKIVDLDYVFQYFVHHRAADGVHWNERAHRRMSNMILEEISKAYNMKVPRVLEDNGKPERDFLPPQSCNPWADDDRTDFWSNERNLGQNGWDFSHDNQMALLQRLRLAGQGYPFLPPVNMQRPITFGRPGAPAPSFDPRAPRLPMLNDLDDLGRARHQVESQVESRKRKRGPSDAGEKPAEKQYKFSVPSSTSNASSLKRKAEELNKEPAKKMKIEAVDGKLKKLVDLGDGVTIYLPLNEKEKAAHLKELAENSKRESAKEAVANRKVEEEKKKKQTEDDKKSKDVEKNSNAEKEEKEAIEQFLVVDEIGEDKEEDTADVKKVTGPSSKMTAAKLRKTPLTRRQSKNMDIAKKEAVGNDVVGEEEWMIVDEVAVADDAQTVCPDKSDEEKQAKEVGSTQTVSEKVKEVSDEKPAVSKEVIPKCTPLEEAMKNVSDLPLVSSVPKNMEEKEKEKPARKVLVPTRRSSRLSKSASKLLNLINRPVQELLDKVPTSSKKVSTKSKSIDNVKSTSSETNLPSNATNSTIVSTCVVTSSKLATTIITSHVDLPVTSTLTKTSLNRHISETIVPTDESRTQSESGNTANKTTTHSFDFKLSCTSSTVSDTTKGNTSLVHSTINTSCTLPSNIDITMMTTSSRVSNALSTAKYNHVPSLGTISAKVLKTTTYSSPIPFIPEDPKVSPKHEGPMSKQLISAQTEQASITVAMHHPADEMSLQKCETNAVKSFTSEDRVSAEKSLQTSQMETCAPSAMSSSKLVAQEVVCYPTTKELSAQKVVHTLQKVVPAPEEVPPASQNEELLPPNSAPQITNSIPDNATGIGKFKVPVDETSALTATAEEKFDREKDNKVYGTTEASLSCAAATTDSLLSTTITNTSTIIAANTVITSKDINKHSLMTNATTLTTNILSDEKTAKSKTLRDYKTDLKMISIANKISVSNKIPQVVNMSTANNSRFSAKSNVTVSSTLANTYDLLGGIKMTISISSVSNNSLVSNKIYGGSNRKSCDVITVDSVQVMPSTKSVPGHDNRSTRVTNFQQVTKHLPTVTSTKSTSKSDLNVISSELGNKHSIRSSVNYVWKTKVSTNSASNVVKTVNSKVVIPFPSVEADVSIIPPCVNVSRYNCQLSVKSVSQGKNTIPSSCFDHAVSAAIATSSIKSILSRKSSEQKMDTEATIACPSSIHLSPKKVNTLALLSMPSPFAKPKLKALVPTKIHSVFDEKPVLRTTSVNSMPCVLDEKPTICLTSKSTHTLTQTRNVGFGCTTKSSPRIIEALPGTKSSSSVNDNNANNQVKPLFWKGPFPSPPKINDLNKRNNKMEGKENLFDTTRNLVSSASLSAISRANHPSLDLIKTDKKPPSVATPNTDTESSFLHNKKTVMVKKVVRNINVFSDEMHDTVFKQTDEKVCQTISDDTNEELLLAGTDLTDNLSDVDESILEEKLPNISKQSSSHFIMTTSRNSHNTVAHPTSVKTNVNLINTSIATSELSIEPSHLLAFPAKEKKKTKKYPNETKEEKRARRQLKREKKERRLKEKEEKKQLLDASSQGSVVGENSDNGNQKNFPDKLRPPRTRGATWTPSYYPTYDANSQRSIDLRKRLAPENVQQSYQSRQTIDSKTSSQLSQDQKGTQKQKQEPQQQQQQQQKQQQQQPQQPQQQPPQQQQQLLQRQQPLQQQQQQLQQKQLQEIQQQQQIQDQQQQQPQPKQQLKQQQQQQVPQQQQQQQQQQQRLQKQQQQQKQPQQQQYLQHQHKAPQQQQQQQQQLPAFHIPQGSVQPTGNINVPVPKPPIPATPNPQNISNPHGATPDISQHRFQSPLLQMKQSVPSRVSSSTSPAQSSSVTSKSFNQTSVKVEPVQPQTQFTPPNVLNTKLPQEQNLSTLQPKQEILQSVVAQKSPVNVKQTSKSSTTPVQTQSNLQPIQQPLANQASFQHTNYNGSSPQGNSTPSRVQQIQQHGLLPTQKRNVSAHTIQSGNVHHQVVCTKVQSVSIPPHSQSLPQPIQTISKSPATQKHIPTGVKSGHINRSTLGGQVLNTYQHAVQPQLYQTQQRTNYHNALLAQHQMNSQHLVQQQQQQLLQQQNSAQSAGHRQLYIDEYGQTYTLEEETYIVDPSGQIQNISSATNAYMQQQQVQAGVQQQYAIQSPLIYSHQQQSGYL